MFELFESQTGLLVLAGIAILLIVGAVAMAMMSGQRVDPMDKFASQAKAPRQATTAKDKDLRRGAGRDIKALRNFQHFLEPESAEELDAAKQKMVQAGYYGKNAVRDFHALQFILAIGGLTLSVLLVFVIAPEKFETPLMLGIAMVMPMVVGYFGPRQWLASRIEARKEEIVAGFPDALDLMLICVEAGQSLDQSIQRVSKEIEFAYPALGEEFATVGEQTKAGRERGEVLKDMAKRVDVTDITSFVTVMVQASTYGTSITDALRIFASEMRDKRIMRAEEKANILPTKMTLGTMMFTVPPLLIILIGPSVVGIATELNAGDIMTGM